jgi:hypothetical protein
MALALSCACGACGGGGGDPDGGDGGVPTCAAGELRYAGTLDGLPVSGVEDLSGHTLVNLASGGLNCYLEVYFTPSGKLHLEWPQTVLDDTESAGAGSLNLAAQGGLNAGNCNGAGFPSSFTLVEDGARFTLRELRAAPYCTGAAIAGEIRGCAAF